MTYTVETGWRLTGSYCRAVFENAFDARLLEIRKCPCSLHPLPSSCPEVRLASCHYCQHDMKQDAPPRDWANGKASPSGSTNSLDRFQANPSALNLYSICLFIKRSVPSLGGLPSIQTSYAASDMPPPHPNGPREQQGHLPAIDVRLFAWPIEAVVGTKLVGFPACITNDLFELQPPLDHSGPPAHPVGQPGHAAPPVPTSDLFEPHHCPHCNKTSPYASPARPDIPVALLPSGDLRQLPLPVLPRHGLVCPQRRKAVEAQIEAMIRGSPYALVTDIGEHQMTPLYRRNTLIGHLLHRPSDAYRTIASVWFSEADEEGSSPPAKDIIDEAVRNLYAHYGCAFRVDDGAVSEVKYSLHDLFSEPMWTKVPGCSAYYYPESHQGNNHPGGAGPSQGVPGPHHQG
jgi:hypothetical protein